MSKKMKNQSTKGGGIGTKTISPNQGSPAMQNVSVNQTAQSNAKNSRNAGKRNS